MVKKTTTNPDEMARSVGVDPTLYRQALRDAKFPWQKRNKDWEVEIGSTEHSDMRTVLVSLLKPRAPSNMAPVEQPSSAKVSDGNGRKTL